MSASLGSSGREPVAPGTAAPSCGARGVQLDRGPAGRRRVPTYLGSDLRPGHVVEGPALIDGLDTTMWVPAAATARFDERSTLVLEVRQ